MLVHHPYESFQQSVERFLREAADDPKVRAIKMTLYRTSKDSRGHQAPRARRAQRQAGRGRARAQGAVRRGSEHQVGDRAWSAPASTSPTASSGSRRTRRSRSSCASDYDGLRRYAHVATGNYHAGTARLYTDLGLFTCDDGIGRDLTELFNYLTTGYKPRRKYQKLLVAPKQLKPALLEKIEREIAHPGRRRARPHPVEAQRARGRRHRARALPRLAARRDDRSDRARHLPPAPRPRRRLEHDQGRQRDRPLPRARAHLLLPQRRPRPSTTSARRTRCSATSRSASRCSCPIEDPRLQAELRHILDTQLSDQRGAWDMQSDGSYVQRTGHRRQAQPAADDRAHRAPPQGSDAPAPPQGAVDDLAPEALAVVIATGAWLRGASRVQHFAVVRIR